MEVGEAEAGAVRHEEDEARAAEERTLADRLQGSLPKDLQQIDFLIRRALEDPAVRAMAEKALPPEALPSHPLGPRARTTRGTRATRRERARRPGT